MLLRLISGGGAFYRKAGAANNPMTINFNYDRFGDLPDRPSNGLADLSLLIVFSEMLQ